MVSIIIRGKAILIDEADYKRLQQAFGEQPRFEILSHQRRPYVVIRRYNEKGQRETISLPRWILGEKKNKVILYADSNPLNCQRVNISYGSRSEAMTSRVSNRNSSSKYKGVSAVYLKSGTRWRATIKPSPTESNKYLGTFDTEDEAATKYNEAAKQYHGKNANLNEIAFRSS